MCTKNLYRCIRVNDRLQQVPYFVYVNNLESQNYVNRMKELGLAQKIPCGQCFECKTLKAKEWSFRCMKEASKYDNNIMLTLTYDDEHLPLSKIPDKETGELHSTLVKEHPVLFMKRLRKKFGEGIRFMDCGEYGSDDEYVTWKGERRQGTERPHYHIIIFNFCPNDLVFHKWSYCSWSKDKYPLYKSKEMSKLWKDGFVELNEVTRETCDYVARYTTKKLYGDYAEEEYAQKGRVAPFLNMSRNPGIGYDYFEENKLDFLEQKPMYLKTKTGLRQINSIRYYDKQLEKFYPEEFEKLKEIRNVKIDSYWDDMFNKTDIQEYEYFCNRDLKVNSKQSKLRRVL